MVVELPPAIIQVSVALFVIWSVVFETAQVAVALSDPDGGISSFLTMFFGATGLFVAGYTKAQKTLRATAMSRPTRR